MTSREGASRPEIRESDLTSFKAITALSRFSIARNSMSLKLWAASLATGLFSSGKIIFIAIL